MKSIIQRTKEEEIMGDAAYERWAKVIREHKHSYGLACHEAVDPLIERILELEKEIRRLDGASSFAE